MRPGDGNVLPPVPLVPSFGYKSTHLQIAELDASVDEPAPKGCCP